MPDVIGPNGLRIDDDAGRRGENTNEEKAFDFSKKIESTKAAIENTGTPIQDGSKYVVVERGDCLWKIAEKYHVDPMTLIGDNQQFRDNPNLIHPGQIVVVRAADPQKYPAEAGKAFAEDVNAMAKGRASVPSPGQSSFDAALRNKIDSYMDAPGGRSAASVDALLTNITDPLSKQFVYENCLRNSQDKDATYKDLKQKYGQSDQLDNAYWSVTGREPPKGTPKYN